MKNIKYNLKKATSCLRLAVLGRSRGIGRFGFVIGMIVCARWG